MIHQIPAVQQVQTIVGQHESAVDVNALGDHLLSPLNQLLKANEGVEVPRNIMDEPMG